MGLQHTVDKWTAQSRGSGRGGGVGGSGPEVPYIDFDFTTQTYKSNGSIVDPTDYLTEDLTWGPFELAGNVDGTGLLLAPNLDGNTPTLDPVVSADLISAPFTMVFQFVPSVDPSHDGRVGVEIYTTIAFTSEWYGIFYCEGNAIYGGSQSLLADTYTEVHTGGWMDEGGFNVAAVTVNPTSMSAALNGGNAMTFNPVDAATVRNAISLFGLGRLRSWKVYKGHKSYADLIQLTG